MKVTAMNLSWYSLLRITILFIFIVEVIITPRIYRRHRTDYKTRTPKNSSELIVVSPSYSSQQTNNDQFPSVANSQHTKLVLTNPLTPTSLQKKHRFNSSVCLGSVFTITFLLINYCLRPFTYSWILLIFPVLLPLPFLVLPALFHFKTPSTIICLVTGLSLGAITLVLALG
jgi:hypothetical protein